MRFQCLYCDLNYYRLVCAVHVSNYRQIVADWQEDLQETGANDLCSYILSSYINRST